jgi:hypothetical protein
MRPPPWRRLNRSLGVLSKARSPLSWRSRSSGTGVVGLTLASVGLPTLVSGPSPFSPGCEAAAQTGTNYLNAEVEPWVDINGASGSAAPNIPEKAPDDLCGMRGTAGWRACCSFGSMRRVGMWPYRKSQSKTPSPLRREGRVMGPASWLQRVSSLPLVLGCTVRVAGGCHD